MGETEIRVAPWLEIPLEEMGDAGEGTFHTRQVPSSGMAGPIIDRGKRLIVQAELGDVIHGSSTPEGEPATLLILDFRFLSASHERRFRAVEIELEFWNTKVDGDPVLVKIAPAGVFHLNPTARLEESIITMGAGLGLSGGGAFVTIGANAHASWSRYSATQLTDATSLAGSLHRRGRNWGKPNTARLVMNENPAQKDGVPTQLRAAMLLERAEPDEPFEMRVHVKASVDMRYQSTQLLKQWAGRDITKDSVLFDPSARAGLGQASVTAIDRASLAAVDLASLCNEGNRYPPLKDAEEGREEREASF
ncbi:hypothetical protein BJ875DRAFT_512223 [Amylocarpus encephaloides]|uniref:Uncharacterized protein n=1 Tax=Amylocarpus encephaloides TaxID=45428 RepID=A0A9P7YGM9_9HELO|nr:hypothetical protein BJ875DRAFT_512223 [Amylocarpus encephaloides]